MTWVLELLSSLMLKVVSWLFTKGLEEYHRYQDEAGYAHDIDQKLRQFKDAYKQAFDGKDITKEQRDALKKSISDFLRNDTTGVQTNNPAS